MPIYECCLFDENDKVVSVEVLGDDEELDSCREDLRSMVRSRRCARFEVWTEGRLLDAYKLS